MEKSKVDMRDAFITRLYKHAIDDRDIVFLCNDYGAPSLDIFRKELPGQFFNMAISEQNMISVAAGMALQGKKVFVYSIASFLTLRCLEQIKIDICSMNLPVTLVGVGTAFAYAADGPTHHATEDLSVMRCLANLEIYSPADSSSAELLVEVALQQNSPKYLRFDKGKYPLLYIDTLPKSGYTVLREGDGPCIVATGTMTSRALEVAERLDEEGIDTSVIDLLRIKPLSPDLVEHLRGKKHVISMEEHALVGGIGSALAELIVDHELSCRLKRAGIAEHQLYTYGMRNTLQEECGLSLEKLSQRILSFITK